MHLIWSDELTIHKEHPVNNEDDAPQAAGVRRVAAAATGSNAATPPHLLISRRTHISVVAEDFHLGEEALRARIMRKLWRRLYFMLNRRRLEHELAEEMEIHREMMAADRRAHFGSTVRLRAEGQPDTRTYDFRFPGLVVLAAGMLRRFVKSARCPISKEY